MDRLTTNRNINMKTYHREMPRFLKFDTKNASEKRKINKWNYLKIKPSVL